MIRTAVVGASGYSGAELAGLLAAHPETELVALQAASSAGQRFEDLHPSKRHLVTGTLDAFDPEGLAGLDCVFLALPHGESAKAAARLVGEVGHVIDLSGDLRLPDADVYRKWYGREHPAPELLGRAVYGLPELVGDALVGAELIACAGCHATLVQLAAAPLLSLGESVEGRLAVSAVSGTSGAGRKADVALSFTEVTGSVRAYRVGRHQHVPEIRQGLERASERTVTLTFVPHLAPMGRGIFATIVAPLVGELSDERLLAIYRDGYADAPFVRVFDAAEHLPAVADVVGTNFCDVSPLIDENGKSAVVLGVLDNLVKGAAGQAVQCMNLALGFPEWLGLLARPPLARERSE